MQAVSIQHSVCHTRPAKHKWCSFWEFQLYTIGNCLLIALGTTTPQKSLLNIKKTSLHVLSSSLVLQGRGSPSSDKRIKHHVWCQSNPEKVSWKSIFECSELRVWIRNPYTTLGFFVQHTWILQILFLFVASFFRSLIFERSRYIKNRRAEVRSGTVKLFLMWKQRDR